MEVKVRVKKADLEKCETQLDLIELVSGEWLKQHLPLKRTYKATKKKCVKVVHELKFDHDYDKDILEGIEECDERAVKMIAKDKGISEDEARRIIEEIQQR